MQIKKYFQQAIKSKASDLYLIADEKPVLRISGKLNLIEVPKLNDIALKKAIYSLLFTKTQVEAFQKEREKDLAYQLGQNRFRVNVHFQRGKIALAARVFPDKIPEGKDLGFNDDIYSLAEAEQGLVLVTGPAGAGKSTTLAAMIDHINSKKGRHIITIEDPIEFLFHRKKSVIEQREVGRDTNSFANGLRSALRQDPDVILLGEMRDLETIQIALTAAETGHLVISTLHTPSAAQTIERIVDVFPNDRHEQVLLQLSHSLKAVISQLLIKNVNGELQAVREIMINNPAISNLIRQNKTSQLLTVIQTHRNSGMISMRSAIEELLEKEIIENDEADKYLNNLKYQEVENKKV